ncbi:MAG: hypothetical protein V7K79_03960 [Nostoc sp.]
MFLAITHSAEPIADTPSANERVLSTTHRFFISTNPLVCCGRSTTCTIQQQTSITHITEE